MLTCITCHPDLISATFSEAPFFSERFSRCDETFCYVKIDGADISEMKFNDREDLEEIVKKVLEADNLGALIGGGTGLRYSYLELAVTDVDRAAAAIRSALQQGNVPDRSWILFHDAHLANEWIGICHNSPAPPTVGVG